MQTSDAAPPSLARVKRGIAVLRALWIFGLALTMAPAVSAEIFKCTAKNGLPLYQNFPCEIDSLGSLPSQPAAAKSGPTVKSIQAVPVHPASQSSPPGVALRTPARDPHVGMTAAEVRGIWGEPEEVVQDEPPSGRVEIWQYGDGRIVQINQHQQRVVSVQR